MKTLKLSRVWHILSEKLSSWLKPRWAGPIFRSLGERESSQAVTKRVLPVSSQAGDSIVEVLIAILIVSSVLVAAYQATSHNTASTQDTQEHSQALQLAESQLEYLRGAGSFDTVANPGYQCFVAANTPNSTASGSGEVVSECNMQPNGAGAAIYHVRLTQPTPGTYLAGVTWTSLLGGEQGNVSVYYRPPGVTP